MTLSARSRVPRVTGSVLASCAWRPGRRSRRRRRARRPRGAQPRSSRRPSCRSESATSGSPSSCSSSRPRAASTSSVSPTRPTGRPGEVPSRCGRATSSDCGRRSNARPSLREPWNPLSRVPGRAKTPEARSARGACVTPYAATSRCSAAASTSAASRRPPSPEPSSGSTACSGWGIRPMTFPASLTTPATPPRAPFTSSV